MLTHESRGCLFYPGILEYLIFWVQKWLGGGMIKEQNIKVCNKSFEINYVIVNV